VTRRRVLLALGVWAVLTTSLWASQSRPAVLVLGGIVAVVTASILVMLDLTHAVVRVEWTRRSRRPRSSRGDDPRVSSLRHQVHGAWWTGSTAISDTLVDLLDDRLLAHHRIDRASDPAAAMEALTPTLRRLVSGPRRQTAAVRELRQILTDIEAL
jgi:hypothetical protein